MSARVAVVVLARGASSRLSDKMMLPFGTGTVLSTVLERCKAIAPAQDLILATTTASSDDALAAEASRQGIPVCRGSEQDVVARMVQAVNELEVEPDLIVRACADNPLVMPTVVAAAIEELSQTGCDLVTPFECATLPFGYGMVVMTRACLERIDREARDPVYREHVENYCFEHPDRFRVRYQVAPAELVWPELCLTLDYSFDLLRLTSLAGHLRSVPLCDQPVALLDAIRGRQVWIEGLSTGEPDRADLVLAVHPPPELGPESIVIQVDTFEVAGRATFGLRYGQAPTGYPSGPIYLDQGARGGETPGEFLVRCAELALPSILAGPARPLELSDLAASAATKRVHAERRQGFADPEAEAFPTQIVLELAEGDADLLDELLAQLDDHPGVDLCLEGAHPGLTARAIERLGAERVHDGSLAPDPFRVLRVQAGGELEVAGHRQPLEGSSVAAFWRSAAVRTARAESLNEELSQ